MPSAGWLLSGLAASPFNVDGAASSMTLPQALWPLGSGSGLENSLPLPLQLQHLASLPVSDPSLPPPPDPLDRMADAKDSSASQQLLLQGLRSAQASLEAQTTNRAAIERLADLLVADGAAARQLLDALQTRLSNQAVAQAQQPAATASGGAPLLAGPAAPTAGGLAPTASAARALPSLAAEPSAASPSSAASQPGPVLEQGAPSPTQQQAALRHLQCTVGQALLAAFT